MVGGVCELGALEDGWCPLLVLVLQHGRRYLPPGGIGEWLVPSVGVTVAAWRALFAIWGRWRMARALFWC